MLAGWSAIAAAILTVTGLITLLVLLLRARLGAG
jgi:hypothetical protein